MCVIKQSTNSFFTQLTILHHLLWAKYKAKVPTNKLVYNSLCFVFHFRFCSDYILRLSGSEHLIWDFFDDQFEMYHPQDLSSIPTYIMIWFFYNEELEVNMSLNCLVCVHLHLLSFCELLHLYYYKMLFPKPNSKFPLHGTVATHRNRTWTGYRATQHSPQYRHTRYQQ